jgi:Zn-dependent peptidase ImmA (M78 family)
LNIPDKVKIGWRNYKVNKSDAKRNTKGETLYGEIDYGEQTIYINNEYCQDQMKVTLLHEIIHGIFNKQGQVDWGCNEALIESIAEGIYELILDNPNLFKEDANG